jgi:hypothetical protein
VKKIFCACICFYSIFFPLRAFAFEYPLMMNNGALLINTGIGFGKALESSLNLKCPPVTASFDFALPVAGLPVTLGIIAGYSAQERFDFQANNLLIAGRAAWHFDFIKKAPRLDPYIVGTLGGVTGFFPGDNIKRYFWGGISLGARYFFLPHIGAYMEAGLDTLQYITFGVSFNF